MNTNQSNSTPSSNETDFVNVRMPREMAEELLRKSQDAVRSHSIGKTKDIDPEYPAIIAEFKAEVEVFETALNNSDTITLEVSTDELATLCEALDKTLHCDWDEDESDDYLEIVALWRKDFSNYVEETQAIQGQPYVLKQSRSDSEAFLSAQTAVANLLEKLATRLPAEEVACE